MLFLGTTVLILYDLSYASRFWTQFEAWLGMQFATPNGLKSAVSTENARYHIVCIQGAAEQAELYTKALVDTWATKTPQQAFDFLSKPDVMVTNQSDKQDQLPKIKALDATVQGAFEAIDAQLEQLVAANAGAVERAKAEHQKGERECREATARAEVECRAAKERADAKVVPLAEAMARAEGEAAAARARAEAECRAAKEREDAKVVPLAEAMARAEGEAAAARARAEAECRAAKEREDAKVVPLAEAMTRAEGEAAAARMAKQTHAQAIKRGVMPIVMERAPLGLKIEGGSLRGKATEYMGLYMLDGIVNGRPAWKHTNGSCWVAFDGADWRGQPEADLGQKKGALMLTDADAASPDASSAIWQASAAEAKTVKMTFKEWDVIQASDDGPSASNIVEAWYGARLLATDTSHGQEDTRSAQGKVVTEQACEFLAKGQLKAVNELFGDPAPNQLKVLELKINPRPATAGSSAWAAQPALKCTVATAAELSAAQAAAALRAKEERRAQALLSAGVPPHGLVPAGSNGGRPW